MGTAVNNFGFGKPATIIAASERVKFFAGL
jgi:hypothetical protein